MGLTGIDGHADPTVPAVTLVTGTQVLVWTGVGAGGEDVADLLQTRVHGWGDH